jgi:hypothetical protein
MPYNLTLDIPVNRDVAERLRQMDEWVDMNPQYVATNIQPDHFPNRMLVGGAFSRDYLQSGTNNRNTPYNFAETMATASAGKFSLGKAIKSVGKVVKPVAKFGYEEILVPVAKELKKEGVKVAKDMLREAIKTALSGGEPAPPSYEESFSHPSYYGYGRKPRGAGRKPKLIDRGVRGGNVYPSATGVRGDQKWMGAEGNIASVVGGTPVSMSLPTDEPVRRGRRGGSSGGKFNLKKALSHTGKDIGKFVREDYTPFMVNKVAPVAKDVGVHLGRELLPVAFEAVGAEMGVPPVVSGVVGRVVADRLLSEKNTGVRGGKRGRPKKSKSAVATKAKKSGDRGAIVKKIMKEKGLNLPQASKYVKDHGLY